jgi:hypothetical protein
MATRLVAQVIDVRQAQLFIDDAIVETSTLVERVFHQPIRHPANPLLSPEEPWEGPTMNYLSGVYRDQTSGLFRVWYVGVVNGGVPGMPKVFYPICTAHSKDGIHWQRPKLDSYAQLTGGPNNIVLHLDHGCIAAPNIIYEPEDPVAPWKLFIHHSPTTPCHYFVRHATSHDGLHWEWKTTTEDQVYAKLHDRMTVAVLDESGHTLDRYTQSNCEPLAGDFPAGVLTWSKGQQDLSPSIGGSLPDRSKKRTKGQQDLDPLIGKTIRLRFFLKQAEIFSFHSTDGSSL